MISIKFQLLLLLVVLNTALYVRFFIRLYIYIPVYMQALISSQPSSSSSLLFAVSSPSISPSNPLPPNSTNLPFPLPQMASCDFFMWGSHFLKDVSSNTRPGKHEVQHQTQCGSTGSKEVIFEKIVKIYEYLLTKLIYLFPTAFAAHN